MRGNPTPRTRECPQSRMYTESRRFESGECIQNDRKVLRRLAAKIIAQRVQKALTTAKGVGWRKRRPGRSATTRNEKAERKSAQSFNRARRRVLCRK